MLRKYLSSLRSTYFFMIAFGLLMGVIFPFYSCLFFGSAAFSPLYAVGCLTAGFLVGTFCFHIIKQVMRFYLERQWQTLSTIVGESEGTWHGRGGDELQLLLVGYDRLMGSVLAMVDNVSSLIVEIVPFYQELSATSRTLKDGNDRQVKEVWRTQSAAEGMRRSFERMLHATEDLNTRTDSRAEIAGRMSAATDSIADNIGDYSAAVSATSSSIEQMAVSLREMSAGIAGFARSTEETSASIIRISSSIGEVRDNAQRSSDCSEKVRLKAQEGMRAMEATRRAMGEIERANEESTRRIALLADKSAQVGEIVKVIQDVVQQTGLLSLNAFIIAAQAGENGKAFSVVAQEVKSLALRTADSAGEIERLLNDILQETAAVQQSVGEGTARVRDGVRISALTADALARIEESAEEASGMVRMIAGATEEQATGSQLIAQEAEKNRERGRQIAAAIGEQERATQDIVRALGQMRDLALKITSSSQDQAKGNRLYLASVLDDRERARDLKEESLQQLRAAEEVEGFLTQAGSLIVANADEAKQMAARIETVSRLTERLTLELAPFRRAQPPS